MRDFVTYKIVLTIAKRYSIVPAKIRFNFHQSNIEEYWVVRLLLPIEERKGGKLHFYQVNVKIGSIKGSL